MNPTPALPKAGTPRTFTQSELLCFLSVAVCGRTTVRGLGSRETVRVLIGKNLISEIEDEDDDDEDNEEDRGPGHTHALTEKGKVFLTMLIGTPLPVPVSTYIDPRFPDKPIKVEQ